MDIDNLVKMANRIGEFFAALPDAKEAQAGIAGHLQRFWEPRMRREIVAHVERGGEGLSAIVREAIAAHRDKLAPARHPEAGTTGSRSSA
jgi:formate dehydrogenase subunit delta